jgi:hypothetical protein
LKRRLRPRAQGVRTANAALWWLQENRGRET